MIQNLVVTGKYRIEADKNGNFLYKENKINIKEIPIIRYRFDYYTLDMVEYIKENVNRLGNITHLVEIKLNNIDDNTKKCIKEIDDICAIFLYIDIYDRMIEQMSIDDEIMEKLCYTCDELNIDRICMVDKTSKMNSITCKQMIDYISNEVAFETEDISVCSSPLSHNGYACLNAVKAREIMAEYSNTDDAALPTANHEKSNCGCIRSIEINEDTRIEVCTQENLSSKKNKDSSQKKKKAMSFGCMRL